MYTHTHTSRKKNTRNASSSLRAAGGVCSILFVCLFIYLFLGGTNVHTYIPMYNPSIPNAKSCGRKIHTRIEYIYIYIYIDRYMYEIGCAVYSMKMKKKITLFVCSWMRIVLTYNLCVFYYYRTRFCFFFFVCVTSQPLGKFNSHPQMISFLIII
jgi:hypothetical protein